MLKNKRILSIVFFSCNRSGYLDRCVREFLTHCHYPRHKMELIISDDGSEEEHKKGIRYIAKKFKIDQLILNPKIGMGASANVGLRAACGEFLLHLQDDFALLENDNVIIKAIEFLSKNDKYQLARLIYKHGNPSNAPRDLRYSDTPHMKTKKFHESLGYYKEGIDPNTTEKNMTRRFAKQKAVKIRWIGNYFKHFGYHSIVGNKWKIANTTSILFECPEPKMI